MISTTVELIQNGILVSGPTIEGVREEINTLVLRNSQWGSVTFLTPVKDASGMFVSRGHIRLDQPEFRI